MVPVAGMAVMVAVVIFVGILGGSVKKDQAIAGASVGRESPPRKNL